MKDESKKRKPYKKKRFTVPIIIIVILVLFRIFLPYIVKNYVNGVLADIPGYYGQVKDIDISLIRGAYVIDSLYLNTVKGESQIPLINLGIADISIEWKSLIKGKIVSEIEMTRPQFNYVFEDQAADTVAEADVEVWTKALTDLVPIDINNLKIIDGKASFLQIEADPNIDLYIENIDLIATNLRNVDRGDAELPSELHATAISIGEGQVKLDGKMDIVKEIPDMDIGFSLENATVTALNDFTNYYAGIDFARGNFNLYSEFAIAEGFLTGYIKPLLKDSKLIEKEDKFLEKLWEGFVGFFKFILKNQGNNTLATKVPIEGDLNALETKILPTVLNVFKNAFISAYKGDTDNTVTFEDAEAKGKSNTTKSDRKEERRQKRAERKAEKKKN
ncbi:MAG TPA: DUF748 domain-containing protein [Pricia antarctica]|uniref:DUF748 domain-containing protein n=2 Tax=root TaxID=1 RepID=A0A831VRV9_9FLAO|nr:DUF748 domain-containing protein [Pricia antarctica]